MKKIILLIPIALITYVWVLQKTIRHESDKFYE